MNVKLKYESLMGVLKERIYEDELDNGEVYCSYNLAVLLEDVGFTYKYKKMWIDTSRRPTFCGIDDAYAKYVENEEHFGCPPLHAVVRWIREKFNVVFNVKETQKEIDYGSLGKVPMDIYIIYAKCGVFKDEYYLSSGTYYEQVLNDAVLHYIEKLYDVTQMFGGLVLWDWKMRNDIRLKVKEKPSLAKELSSVYSCFMWNMKFPLGENSQEKTMKWADPSSDVYKK